MRVFLIACLFSAPAFSMTHLEAFNVLHQVASKVPMVAADHAKVEEALGMLKVLAAEKHAEIQQKAESQRKEALCSEPEKK